MLSLGKAAEGAVAAGPGISAARVRRTLFTAFPAQNAKYYLTVITRGVEGAKKPSFLGKFSSPGIGTILCVLPTVITQALAGCKEA